MDEIAKKWFEGAKPAYAATKEEAVVIKDVNAFSENSTNHSLSSWGKCIFCKSNKSHSQSSAHFPIDECSPQSKDLTKLWFKDFLITKPIDFLIKSLVFFHLNSKGYPPLQNKVFSQMVQTCNTDSGGTSLAHACRNSGTPCTWDIIFKWVYFSFKNHCHENIQKQTKLLYLFSPFRLGPFACFGIL